MSRRTSTLVSAVLLVVLLAVLGTTLKVPLVALGPGPTFDTLGSVDGTVVVSVEGRPVYPTTGHLNMTTVSVIDGLTALAAIGFWVSGGYGVVPRSTVFDTGKTAEQVQQENTQEFTSSEINAKVAAMDLLHVPTRVLVAALVPGSAAAGVLQVGAELVMVAGKAVDTPASVSAALAGTAPGQTVDVSYRFGGEQHDAQVVLGASPDRNQGLLGVVPGIEPRDGDITIKLGDIGGPSAGLMFALAVVDKLTPDELTGGRFVAGTGVIDAAGVVGPIGGIRYKMRAARDAGATVFLVPTDNCAEAAANDPAGLRLIRVTTLPSAVRALESLRADTPTPACS